MMIGKKIRLERIINRHTGRTVIAPMDHGVSDGPMKGIIDIDKTAFPKVEQMQYLCIKVL